MKQQCFGIVKVLPSDRCDNLSWNLVMIFPRGQMSHAVGMLIDPVYI